MLLDTPSSQLNPSKASTWTLSPIFDLRYRYERRLDRDFNETNIDNRWDLLQRYRAGVDLKSKTNAFRFVFQDVQIDSGVSGQGFRRTVFHDASEAYWKPGGDKSAWIVGRQKIGKGEQRLLGIAEWAATARGWDGVRYTDIHGWDGFAGRLGLATVPNNNAHLAFISKNHKGGETALFIKNDVGQQLPTTVYTLNHRWIGMRGNFEMMSEGSYQQGQSEGKNLRAFAASARIKWNPKAKWSPYGEFNVASGGSNSTSTATFDNLYPNNHFIYGVMDMEGLRNILHFSIGVDYRLDAKTRFRFEFNHFDLFDPTDGWYAAGGTINRTGAATFIDPTGKSGRNVGSEFDFYGVTDLDSHFQLHYGGGIFTPGPFIRSQAFNAGTDNQPQLWGYLQLSYKF